MNITLKVYANLKRHIGQNILTINLPEGALIEDLFTLLLENYGKGVHSWIYGERVAILINGNNINSLEGIKTPLKDNAHLTILPIVSGG